MKKKNRKRFFRVTAISMIAAMLMTMSPVSAEPEGNSIFDQLAANDRASIQRLKAGNLNSIGVQDAYNGDGVQAPKLYSSGNLPASFDLRDTNGNDVDKTDANYVTPVKLQNPFGTCWGFSAIAAAETSAMYELKDDPDWAEKAKNIDLSERHLAWFAKTALPEDNDVYPAQGGEGTSMFADVAANERFNTGGMMYSATSLFSSGIGPIFLKAYGKIGMTLQKT